MESNQRYHARRAVAEAAAAERAITQAARDRRMALAHSFAAKAGCATLGDAEAMFLRASA